MLAMRRTFDFKTTDDLDAPAIYDDLLAGLRTVVANRLGMQINDLHSWPAGVWSMDAKEAAVREWRRDGEKMQRLLELTWQEERSNCIWRLYLTLGCDSSELVTLGEVWQAETPSRALPFEDLPPIMQFLTSHRPFNRDGHDAVRALILDCERVGAFRDFIMSPTRALPVVVFSPRFGSEERVLASEFARELMGLAIVIRFEQATQDMFDDAMDPHRCYNGAVRLYVPGYQETDRHWLHPFWQRSVEANEVKREITDRVARESVMTPESPALEALRRQRDEQLRSESEALHRQARQYAKARLEAEQSVEAYENYFNEVARENAGLRATNQTLQDIQTTLEFALRQKDDELRQLRWRVDQVWHRESEDSGSLQPEMTATILLSRQAQDAYRALDETERDYWNKHLFSKLTEPERRDNQSRPVRSRNNGKPCFVYPSSRTADGRRVIYYCEENEVRICEIFTSAQHDRDYDTLRDEGVDRDVYDGFADLKELLVNDTR